jgi:hypothetical protein
MKKLIMVGTSMLILMGSTSFINVTKQVEAPKQKCIGYTVIDAHTVQWCDGRIEKKDWQIRIGK